MKYFVFSWRLEGHLQIIINKTINNKNENEVKPKLKGNGKVIANLEGFIY